MALIQARVSPSARRKAGKRTNRHDGRLTSSIRRVSPPARFSHSVLPLCFQVSPVPRSPFLPEHPPPPPRRHHRHRCGGRSKPCCVRHIRRHGALSCSSCMGKVAGGAGERQRVFSRGTLFFLLSCVLTLGSSLLTAGFSKEITRSSHSYVRKIENMSNEGQFCGVRLISRTREFEEKLVIPSVVRVSASELSFALADLAGHGTDVN